MTDHLKREAVNDTKSQTASLFFSPHPMDKQGSACCHNFLTVTPSYHSKVNHVGSLVADKLANIVLLFVCNRAFPANETQKPTNIVPFPLPLTKLAW